MRIRAVVLAGLVLLVVAGALGSIHRLRVGPPLPSGVLYVPGLQGGVDVLYDSLGIPHLWAERERDVYVAQGWVTGRDRLWQMEMFRRAAEGRLSEIFGERALEADRFLRTVGMARAAARTEALLDSASLDHVRAYVEGVNAAIEDEAAPIPPEFVVLRVRPERWTVTQALSLEKVMAWDLSEYERSLDLAEAASRLTPEELERLLPRYPEWGPTIVVGAPPEASDAGRLPSPRTRPAFPHGSIPPRGEPTRGTGGSTRGLPGALFAGGRIPALAAAILDAGSVTRASNSWVVGPERSLSGRPLLANDMHLALNAPTLWYLVGLHAPGLDVVGMSLPGFPGVVAGRTAGVAWGFTNAMADDSDFFLERTDPADSTRYLTPGGSEPFRVRAEEIRVRGREEPVLLRVRETRHGPVISSVEEPPGGTLLAFRWVAHDPSTTAEAVSAMNRARSVEELLRALRGFSNPHLNVVFADTAGRWGYWMAGRIPLRAGGTPPLLPVPGWTGEADWVGYLDFGDHPHALEPREGFLVTANNRPTRAPVSALISDGSWAPPYRAMRIRQLLEERGKHDAASLQRIQLDVGSAFAERYLPHAVAAFREAGLVEEAALLERWDGRADLASVQATLFHAWIEALRSSLRLDLYGGAAGYIPLSAVARALDGGRVAGGPAAARRARETAGATPWGEANRLVLDHALATVPVVGRLLGFGRDDIARAGQPHSINVAEHVDGEPPFRVRHGPSQRHVADLGAPDGAGGFVLPGGQSGWPASARSWDQLSRWREGGLVPLPLSRSAVEARAVSRLRLRPLGRAGGP